MRIPLRNHSDKPLRAETQILRDEPAWDDATVEEVKQFSIRNEKELSDREAVAEFMTEQQSDF